MKRIIIHHTGGTYTPNAVDRKAYHYVISGTGEPFIGTFTPEDNENCNDGVYAAHTKLGNTGSIGVAFACNLDYSIKSKTKTKFPLTREQYEAGCKLIAALMYKYNIPIQNVFTHYEFDKIHNINQGKSDITYLPWKPQVEPDEVQIYFRQTIMWYYNKLKDKFTKCNIMLDM